VRGDGALRLSMMQLCRFLQRPGQLSEGILVDRYVTLHRLREEFTGQFVSCRLPLNSSKHPAEEIKLLSIIPSPGKHPKQGGHIPAKLGRPLHPAAKAINYSLPGLPHCLFLDRITQV
jgi:hypothetical protein